MECREERLLEWLDNNIASLIVYRESPINANRTAIYDDLIEQQRVAISAVKTCTVSAPNLKRTVLLSKNPPTRCSRSTHLLVPALPAKDSEKLLV